MRVTSLKKSVSRTVVALPAANQLQAKPKNNNNNPAEALPILSEGTGVIVDIERGWSHVPRFHCEEPNASKYRSVSCSKQFLVRRKVGENRQAQESGW
jgi:hypothetical protein